MSTKRIVKKVSNVFVSQEPALLPKQANRNSETAFADTLRKVGFVIGEKNNANELNVDQAVFIRDLTKKLTDRKFPSAVEDFVSGFEAHLEDEIRLKWSLMPTVTTATCESARSASQDSLVHLLLDIDVIQEKITHIMLEKLVEFSYCENSALYDRSEGKTVACLIISQFRWLNKLVNGEALADKLIELIEATPSEVQRDIIKLLPDVINEFDHAKVAKNLGKILLGNQELNVTILDTLTNLNIDSELLSEIRKRVLETIPAANIEDLPVIVKFVLQDLTAAEATETINELQNNIDFNSTFNPILSSTPLESKRNETSQDIGNCVLNTVKYSLKFQKCLCDAWFKHLDILKGPRNHKSLDIFVILIFLSLEINEKKVESMIKNKIKSGDINEDLLHVTFRCHHRILQEYARELLKLAEALLHSIEPVVSVFGSCIYVKCFIWFDAFYKQEVIGNLITHAGNKSENEVNAALNTLVSLVRSHTQKMVPFALFLKNLLDHFDDLTLNQIRKVHEMLSILAYQGGREGAMLLDDMLIVIRKQLTNKSVRYRKMGVIGALTAAKTAAEKENDDGKSNVSISSEVLDIEACYEHSIKLLELVAESTSESCEAFALFCDELSHIMIETKFGVVVLEWIGEHILSDFEETFIIDVKPDEYNEEQVSPKFGLDEVNEPIAIDLYNIVQKDFRKLESDIPRSSGNLSSTQCSKKLSSDQSKVLETLLKVSRLPETSGIHSSSSTGASPVKLAPVFRLLRIFRQIQDGNLEAIDALLGCSIMLPELRIQKFSVLSFAEKHVILNTLFYCINWIRENINAFVSCDDDDIKCNILCRLQLLIEMENLVCKYMNDIQNYIPPTANFDCEEQNNLKLFTKKSSKRKLKGKKKASKKAKTDENTEQSEIISNASLKSTSKSTDSDIEEETPVVNIIDTSILKNLQPFFRELDIDVFALFKLGVTFQKRGDIFANQKVTGLQLHPNELIFLLNDLNAKLNFCLCTTTCYLKTAQKQSRFANLDSHAILKIVSFCVLLLPSLCNIAENCAKFFRNITDQCDGIEDSLLLFTDDSQCIMKCMNLIFKALKQVISWKNFNLGDNDKLLKKTLNALSGEQDAHLESASRGELVAKAVAYFIEFADTIPSLSSAATFTQLLSSLLVYTNDSAPKVKVSEMALAFLKKSWFDLDNKFAKVTEINENIKVITEAYIQNSCSMLESLNYLCEEAIPQLMNDDGNIEFNTLSKSSLTCYYKIMLINLVDYVKRYFMEKHSSNEQICEWSIALKVFQVLTNLIKAFGSRSNIGACLKFSREFLNTFLRYGMPLMDKLFISNKEEIICLMKTLQVSTRYLQHVCSHSKVLKDVFLIKYVPSLKKSLEVFVFRVKMMLAVNKCEEAFWLGNLKNRDIKGVEILTQVENNSEEGSEPENNEDSDKSKTDSELSDVELNDD